MSTTVVLENVRFSYLTCFEPRPTPSGDLRYSAAIMIPEDNKKAIKAAQSAIDLAIKKGVTDGVFTKAQAKSLRPTMRNGTEEHESGDRGKEFDGHFFINANAYENSPPGVLMLDENGKRVPVLNTEDFYSGCYGHVQLTMKAYNTAGNRGIRANLNHLLKVKDGERLDGRTSADDAFSQYGEGADPEEEDVF